MVADQESEVVQAPVNEIAVAPQKSNEQLAWEFFINKGFTKEQTAGILGNLKQEHGFNTSDEAGGLGIAQWLGSRRERLIQRGNHLDFNVQLNFIMEELDTTEQYAHQALRATTSVEQSTIAFQNFYERCGNCMQQTRINYAFDIYYKYR